MDERRFYRALAQGRPYFGPKLASLQGDLQRHAYMTALLLALHRQSPPGPFRLLEIGSWAGGSAITWARALGACGRAGHILCVDSWKPSFNDETDRGQVYDEMRTAAGRGDILALCLHNLRAAGVEDRVILMRGSSDQVLPMLAPGSIDLAFVDGDHTYGHVSADIQLALPLLRDGGVLCGDDLEIGSHECDPDTLRAAVASGTDYVLDPRTGSHFHPGVTAAVADLLPRVSVWQGFWAVQISTSPRPPLELRDEDIVVPEHLVAETPATGAEPEDDVGDYRFLTIGTTHYAINRLVDSVEVLHEPTGAREIPLLVLIDNDFGRLKTRVADAQAEFRARARRMTEDGRV